MVPQFCSDTAQIFFSIFGIHITPSFFYYLYIPVFIITVCFSYYVVKKEGFSRTSKLFFVIAILFLLWTLSAFIGFATAHVKTAVFAGQVSKILEPALFLFAAYFVYALAYRKDLHIYFKWLFSVLMLPFIILLPTVHNIKYFDTMICRATPGVLFQYATVLEALFVILMSVFVVHGFVRASQNSRIKKHIVVIGGGLILLLTWFFVSLLAAEQVPQLRGELYGTFGISLFIILFASTLVEFENFYTRVTATNIFVALLGSFIFGMLFVQVTENTQTTTTIILIFTVLLGTLLVRATRKEEEHKVRIEKLEQKLERSQSKLREIDKQKTEFASIASHQLRGPLTTIRGYVSMILEGSYGRVPKKILESLERVHESSRFMAMSVEDYLSISRIEEGTLKYNVTDFNVKQLADQVADDFRTSAIKKGLVLISRSDCTSKCIANADISKVRQALYNLVDNALKYTKKGTVTILTHDNVKKKKVYITVHDTGIGMTKREIETAFDKFTRSRNAHALNVTGSGLGLYVAHRVIEDMGGAITIKSDGAQKGSSVSLELPLQS